MAIATQNQIRRGVEVLPTTDIVFIKGRLNGRFKGVVQKLNDGNADVEFRVPARRDRCMYCNHHELGLDMDSGVLRCDRRNCCRGQGYTSVTLAVPLDLLEPYSKYVKNKDRVAWQKDLAEKQRVVRQAQSDLEAHLKEGEQNGWVDPWMESAVKYAWR